ncbi:SAM-dependent methyltransferase [Kitasatospora sp. NPDC096147]|uniref:SAM-dependent methyltransferase n=1 Tax=Kitasatospora sp. NPDC096147 TaxID=3364093 RepID=UPI0038068945
MSTQAAHSPGVTTAIGRTALLTAAARAIETHRPDALARDPYAEHFVQAEPGCADWPAHPARVDPDDPLWGRLAGYFALRTRILDEHLLAAPRSGIRQVVLLGAGLDSRAHRLEWPAGTTVWELDRPEVLAFKQRVLDGLGAEPAARRRTVATDLREDWPAALSAAGHDRAQPTAWLAEGLLLYLPGAAEQRLIAAVDTLSAPGSTLAYEVKLAIESTAVRSGTTYRAARERIGIDLLTLFAPGPRPDTATDLEQRRWHVTVTTPFDHLPDHPRAPRPVHDDPLAANRWTFATKRPSR